MDQKWILGTRLADTEWAVEGFKRSGVPLVAYKDGQWLQAGSVGDDPGAAFFVSLTSHYLDLPFQEAYPFFFTFCLYTSCIIGITGLFFLFKSGTVRVLSVVTLGYYCWNNLSRHPDVYLSPAMITMATLPWLLYWAPKKPDKPQSIFFFFTGFACVLANFIRLHSGTGILITSMLAIFFWNRNDWKLKSKPFLGLAAGFIVCILMLQGIFYQRDQFLIQKNVSPTSISDQHLFWTAIYLGMGFIDNELGLKYKDSVAANRVEELFPGTEYASAKFDAIMKEQIYHLWRKAPYHVYYTLAAKAGVLLAYFLLYSNIGILAHWIIRKPFSYHFPFFIGLGFMGAPSWLAIPRENYLLGFTTFSIIYGLIGIGETSRQNNFLDSFKRLTPTGKI